MFFSHLRTYSHKKKIAVIVGCFLGLVFYAGFIRAPIDFPVGHLITIPEGASVEETAHMLEAEHVVLSSNVFGILTRLFSPSGVRAGTYAFEKNFSVFFIWQRISKGETGAPSVRVTIPEGATTREMAEILAREIPEFDAEHFRALTKEKEGYLFPETYIVPANISEEGIIRLMESTFTQKIAEVQGEIDAFGKPLSDVIIMASILEKEARLYETRQTVAGILWERINIDMRLQVDAVFGYIYGTNTFSPTFNQLTATDSPYNTYKYSGLPPGPISNPGLEAIRAAVNPIKTPYLYYLTGYDGVMYYGRTFEEHVANRKYLR